MQLIFYFSRYGYYNNQNNNGFYFSKPRYQVYPYSQQDIPPTYHGQHGHEHNQQADLQGYDYSQPQRLHTTVEVQRSHGYEIKPQDNEYRTIYEEDEYQRYMQQQQQYEQGEYDHNVSPVIVLRIPGPAKYAAHLQALLQQYLEIRAAQYIQALQEQEARSQQYQHYSQPDVSSYQQQAQPYPQQVYGSQLFQAHQEEVPSHSAQSEETEPEQHAPSLQEAPIVYHDHDDAGHGHEQQYHSHYEQSYQSEHNQHHEPADEENSGYNYERPSGHLLTTENFPDSKHTQVIFKSTTQQPIDHHAHHEHQHVADGAAEEEGDSQSYNSPLVYHQLEQYYGEEEEFLPSNGDLQAYGHSHIQSTSEENYVTITQRPHQTVAYNYHPTESHEHEEYATTGPRVHSAKRQAHFTEDQMKKFSALMNRLKKKMTSVPTGEAENKERWTSHQPSVYGFIDYCICMRSLFLVNVRPVTGKSGVRALAIQ